MAFAFEVPADYVLTDSAHTFRHVYGLTDDALLLIRPDGYIGHIATRDMLATTRSAAHAMTPLPVSYIDPLNTLHTW